MFDYEKLGSFYLGRRFDMAAGRTTSDTVMYDAKDLTTHAVIVGMTGSGKTGLGITFLEEAAIDGIPALIIDPKGDLGDLMLTFPALRPADFQPWMDPSEALRQGQTVEEYAARRAAQWKAGLADWDQTPDRIDRFRAAADVAIYTPGSDAGIPLTILKSLAAPPAVIRENLDALRERIATAVSGLLTLLGIDADPLRSRDHILLSTILEQTWSAGKDLDLPQLIREIQSPGFTKIGIMDLESIYPAADRRQLALSINNVLASPAFASWTRGEPLDIPKLLYAPDGRPRLAVVSIAHLSDQERMFFVTILLNELIGWIRTQPGTSSLRAILYMDEVFGYLPPTANPPSKVPLLTLLKQARAYGLGLVLATQNPVDLDYKALSNAGTWVLGRLQTERDKLRVLDGLEGASASAGANFDRQKTQAILSGLGNRVFLLNNVHEEEPVIFQSRWSLSFLAGPLTREQIRKLTVGHRLSTDANPPAPTPINSPSGNSARLAGPPVLAPEIRQRHLPVSRGVSRDAELVYLPGVLARGRAHYVDAKAKVDVWQEIALLARIDEGSVGSDLWESADPVDVSRLRDEDPAEGAVFGELPAECSRPAAYKSWGTALKNFLYRSQPLTLSYAPDLKLYSGPEDRAADFRARLSHQAREARDLEIEKLRRKHEGAAARLQDRIRRAQQRVEVEQQQASSATVTAAMSFGTSVLGALFGRKKLSATNINRAATSMRAATRAADQRSDVQRAEDNVSAIQQELDNLNQQLEGEIDQLKESFSDNELNIESYEIRPRKSDLSVEEVCLLWLPHQAVGGGKLQPAYENVLRDATG